MAKKEIEVTITPDGKIEFEGHGFKGGECDKEIKPLLEGLEIQDVKKKPEFFQKETPKRKILGG